MVGSWGKTLDKGDETGVILIDFFKSFDYTDDNLLVPKFNAYGFEN